MKNARFNGDPAPLDSECGCAACRNYSRGYLHHLIKVGEMLGPQLLSLHNLTHYLTLMRRIREAVMAGRYEGFYRAEVGRWARFKGTEAEAAAQE